MQLARGSLFFFAVSFLVLGLVHLAMPSMLTALVQVSMPTPVAMQEIRGVYGGFFFGTGLYLLLCAQRPAWLGAGLAAQAAIMGGLVLGRTLGLIVDGPAIPFIYFLLAVEVVGLAIALYALLQPGRRPAAQ